MATGQATSGFMTKQQAQDASLDPRSLASATHDAVSGARILFLVDELEAITAGGSERQILQMIDICKQGGMRPQICVLRNTKWLTEKIAGCPVTHFQIDTIASWRGSRSLLKLKSWIKAQKFDILQTMFTEANLLGPVTGRLAGVNVILGTRRNLNHPRPDGPSKRVLRWQGRANLLVDQIIANSNAVLERVVETEKTSRKRISVVYNGVDLEQMRPMPEERESSRLALKIDHDQILVGNVSCLRKVKGVEMFVSAAAEAYRHNPRYRFLLVGDGEIKAQLRQTIRMYGLEGIVCLAGAAKDVRPYLAAFDIAVLSSYAEGFSNSLLEYMACGIPVIATDVGGNREALGPCGLLIQPEAKQLTEAIYQMTDPEVRRDFAASALKRVEKFDVAIARRRMIELYAQFLSKGRVRKNHAGPMIASHAGAAARS